LTLSNAMCVCVCFLPSFLPSFTHLVYKHTLTHFKIQTCIFLALLKRAAVSYYTSLLSLSLSLSLTHTYTLHNTVHRNLHLTINPFLLHFSKIEPIFVDYNVATMNRPFKPNVVDTCHVNNWREIHQNLP
jgi:hypothetical protein